MLKVFTIYLEGQWIKVLASVTNYSILLCQNLFYYLYNTFIILIFLFYLLK